MAVALASAVALGLGAAASSLARRALALELRREAIDAAVSALEALPPVEASGDGTPWSGDGDCDEEVAELALDRRWRSLAEMPATPRTGLVRRLRVCPFDLDLAAPGWSWPISGGRDPRALGFTVEVETRARGQEARRAEGGVVLRTLRVL